MSATIAATEAKAVALAVSSIQDIPLERIHESNGNPRRTFDEAQLREFADFVPGNKIRVMLRSAFCDRRLDTTVPLAQGRALLGT